MRLATLKTGTGLLPAGVGGVPGAEWYVDLRRADPSLPASLREILALDGWLSRCQAAFEKGTRDGLLLAGQLLAPIPDPPKVICIGLNYRDHAIESGMEIPGEPVCFSKFGNTIIGPDQAIRLPRVAKQVDFEAELVAVIGKRAYEVPRERALEYVAGYCNGHDVSARDWQIGKPGKQWLLGKTPDTFAPLGPWLVTADEIPNPHQLPIKFRLNGQTVQDSNTSQLIFGVDELVAYLSQLITLEPGDVIFTGTPHGVGMGRKPQLWLKSGDLCEVEVAGLGILRNPVEG